MVKANQKSLGAKAYINSKVNDMRVKFRKAPGDEAKRQLVENFKEITSSEEYKENLGIVREDTDIIRRYARRKKWWDITSEEFKKAKTEFYGNNMDLDFWEDFENLDLWKKVDYIFEKFWDTDYAADLITELLAKNHKSIVDILFDNYERHNLSENSCKTVFNKFWQGPVSLALIFGSQLKYYFKDKGQVFWNITENTLIHLAKLDLDWTFLEFGCIVGCCEDWSIGNHEILDLFINYTSKDRSIYDIPFKKLSVEWQKYTINSLISRGMYNRLLKNIYDYNTKSSSYVINYDINLWKNIDVVNYIFKRLIWRSVNYNMNNFFTVELQYLHKYYHKIIANILIQMWRIDILKYYINYFTWLTRVEKAEILWNTELENKLNKEKFDKDLVSLQQLWEKLWLIIDVKQKGEEAQPSHEEEVKESSQE